MLKTFLSALLGRAMSYLAALGVGVVQAIIATLQGVHVTAAAGTTDFFVQTAIGFLVAKVVGALTHLVPAGAGSAQAVGTGTPSSS